MTFKQYLIMQLEEDFGIDADLTQDMEECTTQAKAINEMMGICGTSDVDASEQFNEYLDSYVELCDNTGTCEDHTGLKLSFES